MRATYCTNFHVSYDEIGVGYQSFNNIEEVLQFKSEMFVSAVCLPS